MTRTNRDLIRIAETMQKKNFENSFYWHFADLMMRADNDNRLRLANAFPELMVRYEVMHTRKVKEGTQ
jgi:hypothetical protein